jgi:hypothetical protein
LGLCVYERLHRINLRLREEESTCQVLAAVAIEALCRSFEVSAKVIQINWRGCEKKWSWPTVRYYRGTWMEGPEKSE